MLSGRIEVFPDAGSPFEYNRATVVSAPIPCTSRAGGAAAWREAQHRVREIARRIPVDTAAAVREMRAEWDSLRVENRAVGVTLLSDLLRAYYAKHRSLPNNLGTLLPTGDMALDLLPNSAFLTDSWMHPYRYIVHGRWHFDLRSSGPDGRFGTTDDTAWTNIAAVHHGERP